MGRGVGWCGGGWDPKPSKQNGKIKENNEKNQATKSYG